jgi:hypothetical protein
LEGNATILGYTCKIGGMLADRSSVTGAAYAADEKEIRTKPETVIFAFF